MAAFISLSPVPCFPRQQLHPLRRQSRSTPSATAASSNHSNNSTFRLNARAQTVSSLYRPASSPQTSHEGGDGRNDDRGGDSGGDRDDNWDSGADDKGNSPLAAILTALSQLTIRYNALLTAFPLRTKSISAGILALISDLLAQALAGASLSQVDIARLARYALYGLLIVGPQGHLWFGFLERTVRLRGPPNVIVKVLLDQLAFAPVAMMVFFGAMRMAEGGSFGSAVETIKRNLVDTMKKSYRVWPVVNLVNFACVPPAHRVAFTSAVSVFWMAFLSIIQNGAGKTA